VDGGELLDRVIEQRFKEADAADAIYQMLLAVNYVHHRHVVHGDLKLENFLYAHPGSDESKLIDFGFSYFWDSNTSKPTGCTLEYTAPEAIAGRNTSKSDLWSPGVIAFILIFGYMPFEEETCIKKGQWLDKPEMWEGISDMAKDFVKQLLVVALVPLAVNAAGIKFAKKGKLDINQKVYIENQPVLGDGAGEGALNKCTEFADQHVNNPDAPAIKVCGTGIKMTAYLRGRCEGYYEHHKEIGTCDTGAPPSTCQHYSPSDDPAFGHYQSYLIEQC